MQDGTGVIENVPGYGRIEVYAISIPADGTAGYAPGCILHLVNATGGALFVNEGSVTSSLFRFIASGGTVNATSTLTVTRLLHDGKTITLNAAAGQVVALPAAIGSGAKYKFVIGTTITSNTTTISATGAHMFVRGSIITDATDATDTTLFQSLGEGAATGFTTITLNGTTKGGLKGDIIEIEDVATSFLSVKMFLSGTGTEALSLS